MRANRTWVLIADGSRARIFEQSGRALKSVRGLSLSAELPPNRDLLADRPGRAFESQTPTRHAMVNRTDPHRELKRAFAKRIARVLQSKLAEKRYDRLVVVAPPVTLGDLRRALPKGVRDRVEVEVAQDLIKTPQHQLAEHLRDMLPRETRPVRRL